MNASSPPPRFNRLLLTGAAGALGRVLRPRLKPWCRYLRLSDRADLGSAAAGEELWPAALEDKAAMHALLEGVDAVVHFGGVSVEAAWQPICEANLTGLWHLYEAARHHGVKRIFFASSNHVTGFYGQNEVITPQHPPRPDTLYGLSKAFGENLSRLYFDRYGIETVCLRIGSALPEPENRRQLATWLSHDDLERAIWATLTAHSVGHTILFGCSDNAVRWWDNTPSQHVGFRPRDSSEPYAAAIEAREPLAAADDPYRRYQGGVFIHSGPYD